MAVLALLLLALSPSAQPVPGSLDVQWIEGAEDCAGDRRPHLQVHAYEPRTYILRQSPCADFEAPFLYLLIGSERALLIDTGAIEDPASMPVGRTVLDLLPRVGETILPLLVLHSHGHGDHRAGDSQFASLPSVRVIPAELKDVQAFFGFEDWPNGTARLDLGDRTVDVIPAPGHQEAHVVFYDHATQLVFSGDFLLPGRLLIEDAAAYRDSARRLVDFLEGRPVAHVLGAHIELDAAGEAFPWGVQHHPEERRLQLTKEDMLALPAAFDSFNGFYERHPSYILTNPKRNALTLLVVAIAALLALAWGVRNFIRRRRRAAAQPT